MDLIPENPRQMGIFANEHPKHDALMDVIDSLNDKMNGKKIKLACQDLARTWQMKQEKLSNRYTTRLNEVVVINV